MRGMGIRYTPEFDDDGAELLEALDSGKALPKQSMAYHVHGNREDEQNQDRDIAFQHGVGAPELFHNPLPRVNANGDPARR